MSLYGSLFSGVTGLAAQSRSLGTISENITNVNTVGYKSKTSQFSTLVAGAGSKGAVAGVTHNSVNNVSAQGLLQPTENDTDIAISGNGFFVVNSNVQGGEATGDTMFTRAGHFAIDAEGSFVNAAGHYLMGWKLGDDGEYVDGAGNEIVPDPTSEADLMPVDVTDVAFSSKATSEVTLQASFPGSMKVGDNYVTSSRAYDELGGTHNMEFDFTRSDHLEVAGTLSANPNPGNAGTKPASFTISNVSIPSVTENGSSTTTTSVDLTFDHSVTNADGSTDWTVTVAATNGTVDAATTTFTLSYDADGELVGDSMREVNVAWDSSLEARDSIIALDVGGITFAPAGVPAGTASLSADDYILKFAASTSDSGDSFVSGQSTFLTFANSGELLSPSSVDMVVDWNDAASLAPNSTISFDFGRVGTKSGLGIGGDSFQLKSTGQDGVGFAPFTGVTIDDDGFVIANYKNGTYKSIFRLPIADFNNPNGLNSVEGNAFQSTLESGRFFLNNAGSGGVGTVVPKTLEQSTVDIAREFSNMIITQRAFSSSSTVITTADEMLQELVQIKR